MLGGVQRKLTVTVKLQEPVPQELVWLQVTVVEPTGNVLPEAGLQTELADGVPEFAGDV